MQSSESELYREFFTMRVKAVLDKMCAEQEKENPTEVLAEAADESHDTANH